MEPESHRLDREALLANRVAVADRIKREADELVAAAAQKRRAFFDQFVKRLSIEKELQRARDRAVGAVPLAVANPALKRKPSTTDAGRPETSEEATLEQRPNDRVAAA